jgi:UDP-N-acetylglucosamine 1-carboxyvinyltransferase
VTVPTPSAAERLVVEGGPALRGEVLIGGSKNAALPILAATLLTREECVVDNLPLIDDVYTMLSILRAVGATVELDEARRSARIKAERITSDEVPAELARRIRASFLAVGPLVARAGRARCPAPGGDAIGRRPVNVDANGLIGMGARVEKTADGYYVVEAERLLGRQLYLDYPSHTGTENLLMAACLAKGTTVIKHAAAEPEVAALAHCLVRMGARIRGAGTSLIEVEGVGELYGVHLRCLPDRLEAGTFLLAGLITGGDVTVRDVLPAHLEGVAYKLEEAGVRTEEGEDWVRAWRDGPLEGVELQTMPYPGFPTDLQSCFGALLTQAEGESLIHERVFDGRFAYMEQLRKMGAVVDVTDGHRALISGPVRLRGAKVEATDIRAGAALIIAGLAADGRTEIAGVHHVDRGYHDIVPKLRALGARIERVNVPRELIAT